MIINKNLNSVLKEHKKLIPKLEQQKGKNG